MRYFYLFILTVSLVSCRQRAERAALEKIGSLISAGELTAAIRMADSLKTESTGDFLLFLKADSLSEIAKRIKLDFSSNAWTTMEEIGRRAGAFTDIQRMQWEEKGWLERRIIDGKLMYFNRAASNLVLMKRFHEDRKSWEELNARDSDLILRREHTAMAVAAGTSEPAVPVHMKITYTLTVEPNAVPEGEVIRAWLPFPKKGHLRQDSIIHLGSSSAGYVQSPDSSVHSTVYMEEMAARDKPTVFSISFAYRSRAQYFDPGKIISKPYDKDSPVYRQYTAEQYPHIRFSGEVKRLADSIAGGSENPAEVVRKIYMWFKENVPWAGALEYSIMPDIPGYVCTNMRGDCGMQTFLFMSMLRYKGIPVRWQSGWMVPPKGENLHDWCEVYYEGTGWVPADVSYVLQSTENLKVREFYLTGIDAYRMIVNEGIAGPLFPPKQFLRSEPFDFQRGEVEWRGGNLYFDKWDYDISIEYR